MTHEMTFYGINKVYSNTFKKLGWMVLAKINGHNEKVYRYRDMIYDLMKSIENKMQSVEENDRYNDLKIMHDSLAKLHHFVNETLC